VQVHAEDQLAPGDVLELVDEPPVAVAGRDPLAFEEAERVRACRAEAEAVGPGDPGDVTGQSVPDGARACTTDGFAAFDSALAYRDAVEDFATVEPADDYTATALLAFALAAR